MKSIILETSFELTGLVNEEKLAKSVGSGNVAVFATPMMIALMEGAAAKCLSQFLDEGETSVGTKISTTHLAATPSGMAVRAVAEITAQDGKKVSFQIKAYDEKELIGEAAHERFIVQQEKFETRAAAKLK